ncbi:MAG: hypothetical protein QME40_00685 [bacterium]|nr:hypothetical protein [bacterium]
MEIAIGIVGLSLTLLGLIFAYIWKSNGRLQMDIMAGLNSMMFVLERVEKGQEKGFEVLAQGQREMAKMIEQGQERLAQMLLNQTKILERIEGKV